MKLNQKLTAITMASSFNMMDSNTFLICYLFLKMDVPIYYHNYSTRQLAGI
jgi:hypothetical protein